MFVTNQKFEEAELNEVGLVEYDDPKESGRKYFYYGMEILVYFGFPIVTAIALSFLMPTISAIAFGLLFFLWPVLKGYYAKKIARKNEDPRHLIRSSSIWFDGLGARALRLVRQYSSQSRSLDLIYNWFGRFGVAPYDVMNGRTSDFSSPLLKALAVAKTNFWMGMPVAQDVRSRLEIIASLYVDYIFQWVKKNPGRTIYICEVAGGTLFSVIMGIYRVKKVLTFDYRIVSIDEDDGFAVKRAKGLIEKFGLDENKFHFISGHISAVKPELFTGEILKKHGYNMDQFEILCCIGLADYKKTPEKVRTLLGQLSGPNLVMTANISNNLVERFLLHYFIQWPKMKYRSLGEWKNVISDVFPAYRKTIYKTPLGIFYLAVIKK